MKLSDELFKFRGPVIISEVYDVSYGNRDYDMHSETKMERNDVSHNDIQISSNKSINKNAQEEVKNNSGEKSKNH